MIRPPIVYFNYVPVGAIRRLFSQKEYMKHIGLGTEIAVGPIEGLSVLFEIVFMYQCDALTMLDLLAGLIR